MIARIFYTYIALTYFFSANFCYAQHENNWQEYHLKGKIKSVKQVCYKAIEDGGQVKMGDLVSCGYGDTFYFERFADLPFVNATLNFNEAGYREELNVFYEEGVFFTTRSKYDDNNNLIALDCYEDDMFSKQIKYSYDKENRSIKTIDAGKTYKMTYNDEDNQKTKMLYQPLMSNSIKEVFTYNKQGLEIKKEIFFQGKAPMSSVNKYNVKKQRIETVHYDYKEKFNSRLTFKYNAKGDVKEMVKYSAQVAYKIIGEYTYDHKGNWTKLILYLKDDNTDEKRAVEVIVRELVYY